MIANDDLLRPSSQAAVSWRFLVWGVVGQGWGASKGRILANKP